ncbi:hypothetical protein GPECTOR_7g1212 [Gonium pectorale]|uniref:Transcription elongation factor 1 homolog n=1 Tax=Gonium pectorale TaxID=33097 RepID=A0A150GUF4_GONPE|nr:hypothetical protein GPECTOR_7g1212 [Gonium pectorale]|eukprot:KXZ53318.1 hypothetical protein GPECTOR_7g1212 [Gonium pectorale]
MGKRKGRKPGDAAAAVARKKARTLLPSRFECPFCNMHGTVLCVLKREEGRATVGCEQCGMKYNTVCRTLTEPVDVYHEWLDECEDAVHRVPPRGAPPAAEADPSLRQQLGLRTAAAPLPGAADHDDEDEDAEGAGAGSDQDDGGADETGGNAAAGGRLRLSGLLQPSPLQRLKRAKPQADDGGVAATAPGLGLGEDLEDEDTAAPRSPLVACSGGRRLRLAEGLEHTTRAGLAAGASLHDPAAAALLAERTGLGGAGARGALPAGSSHLQQLARQQQQHQQQQIADTVDMGDSGLAQDAQTGSGGAIRSIRRSSDGGGGGGGGGAAQVLPAVASPGRRQTEAQRQQQAARAFGAYD